MRKVIRLGMDLPDKRYNYKSIDSRFRYLVSAIERNEKQMVEMEYREDEKTKEKVLYYRAMLVSVDASGGFCPGGGWGDWRMVSTMTRDDCDRRDAYEEDPAF